MTALAKKVDAQPIAVRRRWPILVCRDGKVLVNGLVVVVSEKDPNSFRGPSKSVVIRVGRSAEEMAYDKIMAGIKLRYREQ
jgi:hypothetical protein